MAWIVNYIPVKNPAENKRGWNFPYNGGDWPAKDNWYWVWTGKHLSTPAKKAWWSEKEQRFLAVDNVIAWRNAQVRHNA